MKLLTLSQIGLKNKGGDKMKQYIECEIYRCEEKKPTLNMVVNSVKKVLVFPMGTKEKDLDGLTEEQRKVAYVVTRMYWSDTLVAVRIGSKCPMTSTCYAWSAKASYKDIVGIPYPIILCE